MQHAPAGALGLAQHVQKIFQLCIHEKSPLINFNLFYNFGTAAS
jgi:hypothetical protein